jgi:hypothetical protein
MELTKEMIVIGSFRNCLVFDGDDKAGRFTDRLLSLMKYNYLNRNDRRSWNGKDLGLMTTVFISRFGAASSLIWENITKYDVQIIITDQLGEDGPLQKHYKKEGGFLACNDTELVVGIGYDDVMLGSF